MEMMRLRAQAAAANAKQAHQGPPRLMCLNIASTVAAAAAAAVQSAHVAPATATSSAAPAPAPPQPSASSADPDEEDPEVIAHEMASSVTALLELELPTPSELTGKLSSHSLASLVVALTVELRRARARASEAEQLAERLKTLAGQMIAQQASKLRDGSPSRTAPLPVGAPSPAHASQPLQPLQLGLSARGDPGKAQTENWAWSTGHDQRSEQREERRSRSRQRRRRSRSNRRERDKDREKERSPEREARERDRAFVKERIRRAQTEGQRDPAKLGADVEHSLGRYRASCTFMGDRGPVTSVGPWRKTHDKALEDSEEFTEAYRRGGDTEVQKAKVTLLRRAAAEGGLEDKDNEPTSSGLRPDPDGEFLYPTEIEGPSKTSSSLGGYRACVTFPSSAKPTYEGARPRKPIPVKCPWRLGPRGRAAAEADARALCEAYEANGEQGMQEKKRDMFKTADADAKAARMGRGKDDTLQNIFQKSSSAPSPAERDGEDRRSAAQREKLEHSVEEDKSRGLDSRGVRAKCLFPNERQNPSGGPSAPIQISGPWRKRRSEAESDIRELQKAFDEGGLSVANARRMALLREKEDGPQSEPAPKGELTEEDLAKRYGKGFRLAASMGFAAGSGLGREGRGLRAPVEAVDAEVALATATRHLGLGFAEGAGISAVDVD